MLNDSGADVTLTGGTKFTSNKITLVGEAILEGLGQAAVTFEGGVDKGLLSVSFPRKGGRQGQGRADPHHRR